MVGKKAKHEQQLISPSTTSSSLVVICKNVAIKFRVNCATACLCITTTASHTCTDGRLTGENGVGDLFHCNTCKAKVKGKFIFIYLKWWLL